MADPAPAARKVISALKGADISSHDIARIVVAALNKRDALEPEDVALCTNALMDRLRMVPLQDTIYMDEENNLVVRGRVVADPKTRRSLIAAAKAMQSNVARKLVREKVEYAAGISAREAKGIYDILFAKAALWFVQQEDAVYASVVRAG